MSWIFEYACARKHFSLVQALLPKISLKTGTNADRRKLIFQIANIIDKQEKNEYELALTLFGELAPKSEAAQLRPGEIESFKMSEQVLHEYLKEKNYDRFEKKMARHLAEIAGNLPIPFIEIIADDVIKGHYEVPHGASSSSSSSSKKRALSSSTDKQSKKQKKNDTSESRQSSESRMTDTEHLPDVTEEDREQDKRESISDRRRRR